MPSTRKSSKKKARSSSIPKISSILNIRKETPKKSAYDRFVDQYTRPIGYKPSTSIFSFNKNDQIKSRWFIDIIKYFIFSILMMGLFLFIIALIMSIIDYSKQDENSRNLKTIRANIIGYVVGMLIVLVILLHVNSYWMIMSTINLKIGLRT